MMSLTRREFETVSRALLDAVADDMKRAERAPEGLQPRGAPAAARPASGPVH